MTAGESFTFTWNSSNLGSSCRVTIRYRVDGGSLQTIVSSTNDDGSYTTTLPNINSTDVDFVIAYTTPDSNGNAVGDSSDNCTVAPASTCSDGRSITLTEPDAGENMTAGESFTFTWSSSDLGSSCPVTIGYRVNGGSAQTLVNSTSDDGSYTTTLPNINSTDVDFVIAYTTLDDDGDAVGDSSDNCTVAPEPSTCSNGRTISWVEPDIFDDIVAGEPYTFRWNSSRLFNDCRVSILYRVEGGSFAILPGIGSNGISDSESFTATLPSGLNSTDVDFLIGYIEEDDNGNSVQDLVTNVTVRPPSSCSDGRTISWVEPDIFDEIIAGEPYTFRWNSSRLFNDCPVSILYRVEGGSFAILPGISSSGISDSESFTATLPSGLNSTDVDFLIGYIEEDDNGNSIQDLVTNVTVRPPSTCSDGRSINLDFPSAGASLVAGESYSFLWTSDELGGNCQVNIAYTVDGGSVISLSGAIDDDGQETLTIPAGINSNDVDFYITYATTDNNGQAVADASLNCSVSTTPCSEGAFIGITSPIPFLTLDAGTDLEIEWNSPNQGNSCPVRIGVSIDGVTQTLETSYPDNGSYTWSVPLGINSDDVDLVVAYISEDLSGDFVFDGVQNLSIRTPVLAPSLDAPVNQQLFPGGTNSVTFSWAKNNPDGVADYLLRLRDLTTNNLIYDGFDMGDVATYTLNYPFVLGHEYRWTVTARNVIVASDRAESFDWTFSIDDELGGVLAPTITSPTDGTGFAAGIPSVMFRWNKNNADGSANYELRVFNITDNELVVDQSVGDVDNYRLSHSYEAGDTYQWIVRAVNQGDATDVQESGFWQFSIDDEPIAVDIISPHDGSVNWGQNFPSFTYSMTGNVTGVNVELVSETTDSIYVIVENASPTGTFSGYSIDYCWIPDDYKLKIYPTNNQTPSGADISDGVFSINATANHSFTINAPSGGQTFLAGDQIGDITWSSTGIPANFLVSLELARPDGGPSAVRDIFALDVPNSGSFSGAVLSENLPTGQYVVKIYLSGCGEFGTIGSVSALSGVFTVESNYDGNCSGCTTAVDNDFESRQAVDFLCSNCIIEPRADGNYFLDDIIPKEDVANIAFGGLFQDSPDGPNTLTYADDFPTPFLDLQGITQPYQRYGRVLSYLEYGDGISPFTRRNPNYNAGSSITRGQICKVYCETFNIPLDAAFEPFSDVTNNHPEQRYIAKLFDLGVVTNSNGGQFRPNDPVTRREAFLMLYRLMNDCAGCLDDKLTDPLDSDAFYDPGNYTPYNIGRHPSLSDGNFDSYSATGLYLADRGMPLAFSHSYNSYLTELPAALFPVEPLGRGWSHSFHAYIQKIPAAELSPNHSGPDLGEVLAVVWPGGSMHYYKDNASLDKITVGNFDEISFAGDEYTIKKKNQLEFVFARTQVQGEDTYWLKSIRDRNGNTVSLAYEAFTQSVDNGDGTTGTEAKSRLKTITGTTGRRLRLNYEHAGQPDKISQVLDESLNRTLQYNYGGGENRLREYLDAENKMTDYTYRQEAGEEDLLWVVTLPNGNFMTNTYVDGKLRSSQTNTASGGRAQEVDVDWSLQGGGTQSTMRVDDGSNIREYSYVTNALGKIEEIETAGNDAEVIYGTGDYATLPVRIRVRNGTRTLETEYVYSTDGKGNVKEVRQEEGVNHFFTYTSLNDVETYRNPRGFTTTFGYTSGNLTSVQAPIGTTTMGYNGFGQVDWVQNPEGIRIEYDYDAYGNVEEMRAPLGLISTANYDAGSRLEEFANPNNQRTSYEYDNRNLTEKVTRHMLYPTALEVETQYGFDDNGNLRTITNANDGVTEMDYNYFDWLESEQFGSAVREYDYYEDGKLKRITRADNSTLDYTYFETNNLLQNDGYATYGYDNLNRLKTVSKDGKNITYFYDDLNRITAIDYDGHTVSYDYDENSNVINIDYGISGIDVDYTYDENDRLETVTDWLGNVTTYHYLNDGRLTYVSLPNGTRTEYYYDGAGRMDSLVNRTNGGIVINAYGFSLDNLGNHVQERKTEPYGAFDYQNGEETGTYDGRNEVQQYGDVAFTHDANGNIKQMSGGWNISNIEWDKHNMPTAFTGTDYNATYAYDGLGHRRSATRNTVTTEYGLDILGMSRILFEADASGNPTYFYVHGMGMISRIKADDDAERYFHYDFRGSTIAMTDENSAITHQYQYDAFGRTLQLQEEDLNRFRFVGGFGVIQENERMLFMRARYYDTDMGRFLSEDPVWGENLYGYAGNDPINKIDASGNLFMAPLAVYLAFRYAETISFHIGGGIGHYFGVEGNLKVVIEPQTGDFALLRTTGTGGSALSANGFMGACIDFDGSIDEMIGESGKIKIGPPTPVVAFSYENTSNSSGSTHKVSGAASVGVGSIGGSIDRGKELCVNGEIGIDVATMMNQETVPIYRTNIKGAAVNTVRRVANHTTRIMNTVSQNVNKRVNELRRWMIWRTTTPGLSSVHP